jgi:hypothetical protein
MADKVTTQKAKDYVISLLPPWFRPEPGFRFKWDGSNAVVVGWGGWRDFAIKGSVNIGKETSSVGDFVFREGSLIFSYEYKGEFHLTSIHQLVADGDWDFVTCPLKKWDDALAPSEIIVELKKEVHQFELRAEEWEACGNSIEAASAMGRVSAYNHVICVLDHNLVNNKKGLNKDLHNLHHLLSRGL